MDSFEQNRKGYDNGVYYIRDSSDVIVGASLKMREAYNIVDRIAATESPHMVILVKGETGSGKELISKAIHHNSLRNKGPFKVENCAAIPESLLESELYGHTKGAFTGAYADRQGLFLAANNGTILLDEVGDMPLSLQAKLLRVIEERKIRKVGDDEEIGINVRIIASTNKDIGGMIRNNGFREDLYYRLNNITIDLPPLRDRTCDIPHIFRYFLEKYSAEQNKTVKVNDRDGLYDHLASYHWPGNVRELENMVGKAILLCNGVIGKEHFIFEKGNTSASMEKLKNIVSSQYQGLLGLKENISAWITIVEKEIISATLKKTNGNKLKAAKLLKIDYKTLYNKMKEYDISSKIVRIS